MNKQNDIESFATPYLRTRYKKTTESVSKVDWIPIEYLLIEQDSPEMNSRSPNLARSPATLDLKIDSFPSSPELRPAINDV